MKSNPRTAAPRSKKGPVRRLILSFRLEQVNGHHEFHTSASPRARAWILAALVVVLSDSGVGIVQKLIGIISGTHP